MADDSAAVRFTELGPAGSPIESLDDPRMADFYAYPDDLQTCWVRGNMIASLDGGATADGSKIQLYTCNNTAAQTWAVTPNGPIKALGKCLDVSGGGSADGTKIQLYTCNGTGAQNWSARAPSASRTTRARSSAPLSGRPGSGVGRPRCHRSPWSPTGASSTMTPSFSPAPKFPR